MNYRKLPVIEEKQKEIVYLVFKFRFINRKQIQKLFGHKDPSRINKWLKDLVEKKYLGRIYSHKLLENTKPAIYYLNNNGIIWSRYEGMEWRHDDGIELKYLKKFYEDKHASESFINHCITMFDIYLQFKDAEKLNKNLAYDFETKTENWIETQRSRHYRGDFNDVKEYIPDASVEKIVETEDKITTDLYFIILFDSHVPRYAMRYKVDQYIKCHEENDGKRIPGLTIEFPTLLLIFPTQQKANQIGKYIKKQLDRSFVVNMNIQLTTYQKVIIEGVFGGEKTWKIIKAE